jgi:hypothetical protein
VSIQSAVICMVRLSVYVVVRYDEKFIQRSWCQLTLKSILSGHLLAQDGDHQEQVGHYHRDNLAQGTLHLVLVVADKMYEAGAVG